MCVNVRLQTFCPMLMWSLHLPAFNCLRYIQVTTPFSVTFVLLLGKKKCEAHEFACDNNTLCYLKTEKCDGVYDCMDWSDEQGCSKYYFNCLSSQSNIVLKVFKVNNKSTRTTSIVNC